MNRPASPARRLVLLVAAALVIAGCSLADSDDGEKEPKKKAETFDYASYDVRPGPVLGVPIDRDTEDHAAEHAVPARLIEMINHTPPGARIRIIVRSFSLHPVADPLIEAYQRGVRVQVIAAKNASKEFNAAEKMIDEFGTDRRKESFFYLSDGAPWRPDTRGERVHQKVWTFSKVGNARRVVVVGSANLSYYSTTQFSDMYTFVNRKDIWNAFDRNFRAQVGLGKVAKVGYQPRLGNVKIWFFPGWTVENDPIRALIESVPVRDTTMRFAMYAWHAERGIAIANAIAAKARAGARVQVASHKISTQVVRILTDAGVEFHRAKYDENPYGDKPDVHAKLSLLTWTDDQGKRQRRIVTGSDNFGTKSLLRDEVALSITPRRESDWRAYIRWYDAMIARAVREGH